MSKLVKGLVQKEIAKRLGEVDGVAVINPRGIDAMKNNQIRRRLRAKGVRMTVVKNTLARRAVGDGKLKGFDALLDGPSAVIYGEASIATIARLVLDEKKNDEKIELRGVFFDGELYVGDKGVEQVSKLPTREEALGQVVALILAPGAKLGGILVETRNAGKASLAVIGVGLNYRREEGLARRLQRRVAFLEDLIRPLPSRNALIREIAAQLHAGVAAFEARGLEAVRAEWLALHAHAGQRIRVRLADGRQLSGVARGLAEDGALQLSTRAGLRAVRSGRVVWARPASLAPAGT